MLLIINKYIHHKNREGFEAVLKYLNMDFTYGNEEDISNDKYKIIYSASFPVDIHKHPNKLYLFGPHFCVLPSDNDKFDSINEYRNNVVFIILSKWCCDIYKSYNLKLNLQPIPFPVNTDKFNEINDVCKNQVLIYFKNRKPTELQFVVEKLKNKGIDNYVIFSYTHRYNESDFIYHIQKSKYAIIIGRHESQGFAIQEMMSCNLPLFVWDVTNFNQEEGFDYPPYPATSIPYWSEKCGEFFYESNEFDDKFKLFLSKLNTYKPREYVIENLSVKVCAERFKKLFDVRIG